MKQAILSVLLVVHGVRWMSNLLWVTYYGVCIQTISSDQRKAVSGVLNEKRKKCFMVLQHSIFYL